MKKKEEVKYLGKRFFSETEGIIGDDGYWKVISGIGESRSVDGKEWETLFLDAMAIDTNFDRAYSTALASVLNDFVEKVSNRGFSSLFESTAYDKSLEEKRLEKEKDVTTKSKSNKTSET